MTRIKICQGPAGPGYRRGGAGRDPEGPHNQAGEKKEQGSNIKGLTSAALCGGDQVESLLRLLLPHMKAGEDLFYLIHFQVAVRLHCTLPLGGKPSGKPVTDLIM